MENARLDLLTSISGEKIDSVALWEKYRREEIMVLLENFIYGVRPAGRPDDLSFEVRSNIENFQGLPILRRDIDIRFGGYTLPFCLFLPQQSYHKKPVPLFLHILNEHHLQLEDPCNHPVNDFLPIDAITARGYAVAVLSTLDVSPDWTHHSEYKKGVFYALQPDTSKRNARSWATISAWAYGASRVMDYLETDRDVEHTKVAVIGHSRAGKTALWAGATDPRFACVISNCSGCAGAAYTRGKQGEHIRDINISDWFCKNYHQYDDYEEMLPCDQHMLLAAIAPRPLYVKSNVEDLWAGPDEELKSCRLASAVYELYGLPGLVLKEPLKIDVSYADGTIAYHRASGDHDLKSTDWKLYMDFTDRFLKD